MQKTKVIMMGPIAILWALGVVFLLIGLLLKYGMRQALGMPLVFIGIIWIVVLLGYHLLTKLGVYGKQPAEIGYVTNIISAVIIIIGLVIGWIAVKKARG